MTPIHPLLAKLLRADLVPRAHVPDAFYANLRELTRARANLSRHATQAKNELHALVAKANLHVPHKTPFSIKWTQHVSHERLGAAADISRDEILRRVSHYEAELSLMDEAMGEIAEYFPQLEAIRDIHGIGQYLGLLIVAEIAEPWCQRSNQNRPLRVGSKPASFSCLIPYHQLQ